MLTPYDWQEGIGNRASYIENKLAQGAPVLALSLDQGILIFTYRRQARKIFEVYDRLAYSGIGQQNDIEALRTAAIDFAHQEGFQRSVEDVTIQRVVSALSQPIKRAFGDFGAAPIVARSLFAELGATPDEDRYYVLDYDGDYRLNHHRAVVAGEEEVIGRLQAVLQEAPATLSTDEAVELLKRAWAAGWEGDEEPPDFSDLSPEILLIERSGIRENRFHWLEGGLAN